MSTRVRNTEIDLREKLPALHVGRSNRGRWWHVVRANGSGVALCNRNLHLYEDDALENVTRGALCERCAGMQGDEYAEVL